jgi:hypothetical protein
MAEGRLPDDPQDLNTVVAVVATFRVRRDATRAYGHSATLASLTGESDSPVAATRTAFRVRALHGGASYWEVRHRTVTQKPSQGTRTRHPRSGSRGELFSARRTSRSSMRSGDSVEADCAVQDCFGDLVDGSAARPRTRSWSHAGYSRPARTRRGASEPSTTIEPMQPAPPVTSTFIRRHPGASKVHCLRRTS